MPPTKRIVVVGVGSIGERHVRCFQRTGRVSLSIVEIQPQLREEVAARYRIPHTFDSLEAALATQQDAAILCTPAHLHLPFALQCARRGLHLLVEKPLSVGLEQVAELRAVADSQRLVVAVAYVLRCVPALQAMRQAILAQRFGRPVQLVAVAGQHFPTYRPAYREIYYARRAWGGGAIQDALTHLINAGQWLVGPVHRVTADADHLVLQGVTVEDTVHVLARHDSLMASYSLNQYQAPNELVMTVVCERGTVRFEGPRQRFRWITDPGGAWQEEPFESLERDDLFTIQAERFLAALDGELPACSLAEGEHTLRVNLAILASTQSHSWVSI